jgi:hypothetical protein
LCQVIGLCERCSLFSALAHIYNQMRDFRKPLLDPAAWRPHAVVAIAHATHATTQCCVCKRVWRRARQPAAPATVVKESCRVCCAHASGVLTLTVQTSLNDRPAHCGVRTDIYPQVQCTAFTHTHPNPPNTHCCALSVQPPGCPK